MDDEPVNLLIFKTLLGREFTIVDANNGVEGLQKIKEHPEVSVVVSDLQMPVMDGLQFIEKLKKIRPELPCYVMTGFEKNEDILNAIAKKLVAGFFAKPFDDKDIIKEIMKAVK
ncbi:response regulator [Flammeovirgaceae bacterium SG7u.111]|nr:response regulator [Flammeovirgaceae bacterium SG7u.132]WPO37351.1 response regulator [Flammeovirgaceae bacterium SG7u.111]